MKVANTPIVSFLKGCEKNDKPLLVILGPTASGKTALSLEMARKFNGEIISADSRQVYRGLDIGTDKIPEDERLGIPHHLIDVAEPTERFTVSDFKRLAEEKIAEILARGRLPILCGGTGLYLRAITQNFAIPPENPEVRAALLQELEEKGAETLHKKLQQLDPENAAKISSKNPRYVIRALEIFMATGRPKSAMRLPSRWKVLQIGLVLPQETLFERIHRRVDGQLEHGLVEEVKNLLACGYPKKLPALQTLGYAEIIEYLDGRIALQQAAELIKKNTRSFARRQMTWFKKDKEVMWITPMKKKLEGAGAKVEFK